MDSEVETAIRNSVNKQVAEYVTVAKEVSEAAARKHESDMAIVRADAELKLRTSLSNIEDEVRRRVTSTVIPVVFGVLLVTLGGLFMSAAYATRDVHKVVTDLQKDVIASQQTILGADKTLREQTKAMAEADGKLTAKTQELGSAVDQLKEQRSKLEAVAREYETLTRQARTLRQP